MYFIVFIYLFIVLLVHLYSRYTLYIIFIYIFSNLNLSRNKRTTVEISVLILSCVILDLNPVLPVLHYIYRLYIYSLNHDL